jgi:Domain of unknown function (DUF4347)/Bacterial Ig-like domain
MTTINTMTMISHSDRIATVTPVISQAQTLVVFDSRVQDLDVLYRALMGDAVGYTLDLTDDAIPTITRLLSDSGAKNLAIVAHGEPGIIHLGANPVDLAAIQFDRGLLAEWGVAEIAIYSCEVGANSEFVQVLERLTGARVAASQQKVGSPKLGGSWDLGNHGSNFSYFDSFTLNKYVGVLAITFSSNDYIGDNVIDSYINIVEANSLTLQADISNTATAGQDILTAIFNASDVLLYWTIYSTNITGVNDTNFLPGLDLTTALGSTPDGALKFKFYQGTVGPTAIEANLKSVDYAGSSPSFPALSIFTVGIAGTTAVTTGTATDGTFNTTLDRILPTTLGTPDLAATSDSGISNTDDNTNNQKPTFTISLVGSGAVAGEKVELSKNGTVLPIATITLTTAHITANSVSLAPTANTTSGTFTARLVDVAGNPGTASAGLPVTIDIILPTKTTTITSIADDAAPNTGTISSGGFTNDTTPTLAGTISLALVAGEVVGIYRGLTRLGSAAVTGTAWTYADTLATDGNYSYTARVEEHQPPLPASSISIPRLLGCQRLAQ